jgi:hypothetical protein
MRKPRGSDEKHGLHLERKAVGVSRSWLEAGGGARADGAR